jgi:ubiquinone/menaquinone biosynthesis C-methylase UbiE
MGEMRTGPLDIKRYNIRVTDYSATIRRFTGFAATYDRSRPVPPDILAEILPALAGMNRPALLVDLGCGPGNSTRFFASFVEQAVGVDISPDMIAAAASVAAQAGVANAAFVRASTDSLPFSCACADLVTACQSFHWMEPAAVIREIARLLRPGGVFMAHDFDNAPLILHPQADAAYRRFHARMDRLAARYADETQAAPRWSKTDHLQRLKDSQRFSDVREFRLHRRDSGDAERIVGYALSLGRNAILLRSGVPEAEAALNELRATMQSLIPTPVIWVWSSTIRTAIK